MIHLILESLKFKVANVHQSCFGRLQHVLHYVKHGLVEQLSRFLIFLVALDPCLQQILVKAIAQGPDGHVICYIWLN